MTMRMRAAMPDSTTASTLRLINWVSPSFPVGGFGFSHGLEMAVHSGLISTAADLQAWLADLVQYGSLGTDAGFCSLAYRSSPAMRAELCELARSLAPGRERFQETTMQGVAFAQAQTEWEDTQDKAADGGQPYSIAMGVAGYAHRIELELLLSAYLNSSVSNLIQATIRLSVLGQRTAVTVLAGLEPIILKSARHAKNIELSEVGGATVVSDVLSLQHETLEPRIFLS